MNSEVLGETGGGRERRWPILPGKELEKLQIGGAFALDLKGKKDIAMELKKKKDMLCLKTYTFQIAEIYIVWWG